MSTENGLGDVEIAQAVKSSCRSLYTTGLRNSRAIVSSCHCKDPWACGLLTGIGVVVGHVWHGGSRFTEVWSCVAGERALPHILYFASNLDDFTPSIYYLCFA